MRQTNENKELLIEEDELQILFPSQTPDLKNCENEKKMKIF